MTADLIVKVDIRELGRLRKETPERVSQFLDGEAEEMVNGIKQSIQDHSSGRRYGKHIASLPGDPPNVDEGRLINSYTWERDGKYVRYIGTDVEYAPMLELGTSKMSPRPHVGPEVERERQRIGGNAKRFGLVK